MLTPSVKGDPDSSPSNWLERPEIEDGIGSDRYLDCFDSLKFVQTSIDVLEIHSTSSSDCQWRQDLNHEALTQHFAAGDECDRSSRVQLQIIFLKPLRLPADGHTVEANRETLQWLRAQFGVSLLFLNSVVRMARGVKPGHASFTQRDESGDPARIDAMYHIFMEPMPCRIWYTYLSKLKTITYIIFNCPSEARSSILKHSLESNVLHLLRPGVIDAMIVNACDRGLRDEAFRLRRTLLDYETSRMADLLSEQYLETFQRLHNLSLGLHILQENLTDQREVIEFIRDFQRKHIEDGSNALDSASAYESMEYLLSRNNLWKRWVSSYNTRTKIRIDLAFNVASQNDNRTNLKIANTSAKIAQETRKDSSSMITIAALTMLFLPGTFISAIFSMTFFNAETSVNGEIVLKVLPEWWYFPVVTIPLTILVFTCWIVWQNRRNKKQDWEDGNPFTSIMPVQQHHRKAQSDLSNVARLRSRALSH